MNLNTIENLGTYEIVLTEALPDIHAEGILLRHKKTGARVVLIPCKDDNKVFNIAFRTPPTDSTGVAHIVEHTVLCGSEKFPLKDPFVELVKGSLNTFLNAMTYPDKTMYPVASTNAADFRNLMHVYLDAVFHPNIYKEENIFRQEGWNYQLESPDGELKYNGVVYNEMKGAFSTVDDYLERVIFNTLFPDTAYGVESGGDPQYIPDLTYEAYLDFHRRYYHPSNSYIYLYGDLDMADTLSFIDREYLSHYDYDPVDSVVALQKPFKRFKRMVDYYPISEEESVRNNTYLTWHVVTGNPFDIREMIAFEVLEYALFSMPGAPIKQALLNAGIGKDVEASYSDGILQPYFSVTVKNASASKEKEFVRMVRECLAEQAEKGISRDALLAGINSLDFHFREADFGTYPKGLMYSLDLFDTWLYDDDQPFNALKQLDAYDYLRKAVDEGYFENLIKEQLLDNPFGAVVILKPKKGLTGEREAETAKKLADYKASLTPEEIDALVEKTKALRAYQEEEDPPEKLACLPMLKRSDLKRDLQRYSNIVRKLEDPEGEILPAHPTIVYHDEESTGIGYLDLYWDVSRVPEDLLPYLSLLRSTIGLVDTGSHTYTELTNIINMETGGISPGISSFQKEGQPDNFTFYFNIRAKALYGKFDIVMKLIREMITDSRFDDEKRLHEILNRIKTQGRMSMQRSGHSTAAARAAAYYTSHGATGELVAGVSFYRILKEFEEHFDKHAATIRMNLERLMKAVFDPSQLIVSFTCEQEGMQYLEKSLPEIVRDMPVSEFANSPIVRVKPLGRLNEGFKTAGQVQFVAQVGTCRDIMEEVPGAFIILRQIMGYDYLWQNIRVKGGAYGCSGLFKRNGGMAFTSYRDPNLKNTLDVYAGIPEYLRNFTADEEAMTKYIIGTLSIIDTPLTPSLSGSFGMQVYMSGQTMEAMQKTRDEILDATDADIRALAPYVESALQQNYICVVGSEGAIERDKDVFGHVETLL